MKRSPPIPMQAALAMALGMTVLISACKPAEPVAQPEPAVVAAATAAPAAPAAAAPAPAAAPIAAQSGTYTIDPAHTLILAQWNHMTFSNPSANFARPTGTIVYNADDPSASSVNVTIPMSGITSFTPDFDKHLSSADFFDVAKFPDATFSSTAVTAQGGNRFQVTGDLTIKGVTKPVTLDVTLNGAGENPMSKKQSIGFDATANVKRSDWGLDMAAPAVSDAVQLRITTEAQLQ